MLDNYKEEIIKCVAVLSAGYILSKLSKKALIFAKEKVKDNFIGGKYDEGVKEVLDRINGEQE